MNDAYSAGERRWLSEPAETVTCDRHGFEHIPEDEPCPGCEDDAYEWANPDCGDRP